MTEEVKMNTKMQFSQFIDPFSLKEIISSKNFSNGQWRSETTINGFQSDTNKAVLPIKMTGQKILVVTKVDPGASIRKHSHEEEPMLRYIIEGSLVLNGVEYRKDEWVIVPAGVQYEISTIEGYTTLMPYGMACGDPGG